MMKQNLLNSLGIIPLFCAVFLNAQIGIGTKNPQTTFHIDANKDNPTSGTPTSNLQKDDVVVTNDGKLGIGTINPAVRLDVRSANNNNSSIGIGYTTATASEAGAGAIRYYDVSGGLLQVSDGNTWSTLLSSPKKSFVAAHIIADNGTKTFTSTATDVNGWTEIEDYTNDFTPSTGLFTAKRDGVYNVSFSYDFVQGTIIAGSAVEAQLIKNGNTIITKCLKTFGQSNRIAQAGGICNVSISLLKDETLKIRLRQTIDNSARGLRSTNDITNSFFGFNNLSIIEL